MSSALGPCSSCPGLGWPWPGAARSVTEVGGGGDPQGPLAPRSHPTSRPAAVRAPVTRGHHPPQTAAGGPFTLVLSGVHGVRRRREPPGAGREARGPSCLSDALAPLAAQTGSSGWETCRPPPEASHERPSPRCLQLPERRAAQSRRPAVPMPTQARTPSSTRAGGGLTSKRLSTLPRQCSMDALWV